MSERSLGSVVVAIKAVDDASSVLDRIQASMGILGSSLGQLGGSFTSVGNVISGFAAGGVLGAATAGIGELVKGLQWATSEATESQQAWANLQASLKLTGPAWDEARAAIDQMASALQRTTKFSDEEVVAAVQRLTTFGMDYAEAMNGVQTATDLAAAKQIDLQTAADLLGKTFSGNTAILARYGVNIDDIKESMGKGATDAQIYEAVLAKLNEQFGGEAAAQAQTYVGTQERLKNAMSDLGEKVGGIVLPALTGFAERMIPVVDWLGQGVDKVQAWITAVSQMPEVHAAVDAAGQAFAGLQKWFGDVANVAMQELGPALQELWSSLKDIFEALSPIGEAFAEIWAALSEGEGSGSILKDILGLIAENIKLIAVAIKTVAPVIKAFAQGFKEAAEFITPLLVTIRDTVGGFLAWLHDAFEGFYNFLVGHSLWQDLWNGLVAVVQNVGPTITSVIQGLFTTWNAIVSGGMELIKTLIVAGFQLAFTLITANVQDATGILVALIGTVTAAIVATQKDWSDLTGSISGTSDKIKQLIHNLWSWLQGFWQDHLTDMVTRTEQSLTKITTGIQNAQNTWNSTLDAMVSVTRQRFNQMVSDISQAVDAIIARLRAAQSEISMHSIWPDMLSQMVAQTRNALKDIRGEFALGLTGPAGLVPQLEAIRLPSAVESAAFPSSTAVTQTITVPVHVYLDGQEIQTLLERRLIETLNQQAKSVRG